MISLPTYAAMKAALLQIQDKTLYRIVNDRLSDAVACGCEHMTHILIIEPGNGEAEFLREAAFTPFRNPLSDTRYGQSGFEPHWDWAGQHQGWFEWLTCIGNAGFAFIVLVPDRDDIDPMLLAMLREFIA